MIVGSALEKLFLPLMQLISSGSDDPFPPERRTDSSADENSPSRRIMVVEDDYFVALAIEDALRDAGYSVIGPVESGEEAIEIGLAERPDLVLIDIRLAGEMDGIDAATALAENGIRCIFATAHSDAQTRKRAEKAMPSAWLQKPFTSADVVAAVDAVVKSERPN